MEGINMEDWNNDTYGEQGAADSAGKKRNYEKYLEGDIWSPQQGTVEDDWNRQSAAAYNREQYQQDDGSLRANQVIDYHGMEEPVSVGEWLLSMVLMVVPCLNIILMFVWAFGKTEKKSKANFFKAQLILVGIVVALYLVILILVAVGAVVIAANG